MNRFQKLWFNVCFFAGCVLPRYWKGRFYR
jgi:hypothetical protein